MLMIDVGGCCTWSARYRNCLLFLGAFQQLGDGDTFGVFIATTTVRARFGIILVCTSSWLGLLRRGLSRSRFAVFRFLAARVPGGAVAFDGAVLPGGIALPCSAGLPCGAVLTSRIPTHCMEAGSVENRVRATAGIPVCDLPRPGLPCLILLGGIGFGGARFCRLCCLGS